MADEAAKPEEGADGEAPKKSKKKLFTIGGVIGGIAIAFLAAMMGVPKEETARVFAGPFVAPLTAEKVQVNLADGKSFLILDLNIVYDSYDEAYYIARSENPLATAEIKDVLVALTSSKGREDVADPVNKPILMEEIRAAVDPLLFPVHLGDAEAPTDADSTSGVRPGLEAHLGTFRGEHDQHLLKINGVDKTVQVDDGPVIGYEGDESSLEVPTVDELKLYLDVTGIDPEFQGEIKLGVMGRVRRILWNQVLLQ